MGLLPHATARSLGGPEQDIVFVGALLALAASVAFSFHALVCRGLAAQFWKALAYNVRRGEDPAMKELVDRKLRAESLHHALCLNFFVTIWCCVNCCLMVVNIAIGARRWMTFWQDVVWLWATFACISSQLALRHSTRHSTVWMVYVIFMVGQTTFVAGGPAEQVPYISIAGFSVFVRLMWSLACMRLPVVACLTTLHFFCVCAGFMRTEACSGDVDSHIGTFALCEFIGDIGILACAVVWRHFCSLRILHEIQASISQSENKAAMGLLNIVCDATVEIDEQLRITEQAPRFASLLQHGYDRSLQGSQILQFIVSQDQQLFTDRVTAATEDQSMANVFHMRLRDSINNILSVEVFHVQATNILAGDSHLIGVREYADAADNVGMLPPNMGRGERRAQGTRSRRPPRGTALASSDEPAGSAPGADAGTHEVQVGGSGAALSSRSSSFGDGREEDDGEIAVWIDVLSDSWEIKSYSMGFQLFSEVKGAPPSGKKAELLRWIKPVHKDSLIGWVQDSYQEMRSLRSAQPGLSPSPRSFGSLVHFRPPALRRVKIRMAYAARVSLALPEEHLLQSTLAKLVFSDVRLMQQGDVQDAAEA